MGIATCLISSPKLLLRLHENLTRDTIPDQDVGRFRQPDEMADEISVVDRESGEVLFEPPNDHLLERIQQICDFANRKEKHFIHPVVKAIVLHFAIAFVHPFVDGNGRTARAVFYWFMLKHGYWLFQYLPISRIYLQAPAKYKRTFLFTESDNGDATYFIHHHLKVIKTAIDELLQYLKKKQVAINHATQLLRGYPGLNHRQTALLVHALKRPNSSFSIRRHQSIHQVTYPTARSDFSNLVERGFLISTKSGKSFVFFPADDLEHQIKNSKL